MTERVPLACAQQKRVPLLVSCQQAHDRTLLSPEPPSADRPKTSSKRRRVTQPKNARTKAVLGTSAESVASEFVAGSPATNSNRCHNQLITFASGVVCILCEITKEGEELLRLAKEKAAGS